MNTPKLVGAWLLSSFEITFSDGRSPVFPFGEHPRGHLLYAATGYMSAVLSAAARAPVGASRLETAESADEAARAAAFSSYLSYGGRYRVEGNTIFHDVEVALVPELVGTTLVRTFAITETGSPALDITYALTAKSGVTRHYHLRFLRDAPEDLG